MHADLQRLLAADVMTNFASKPLDRLRGIRIDLSAAEGDVSFVRRLVQGRLDIVGHEVERRRGTTGGGTSAMLFDMPEILSDAPSGEKARSGAARGAAVLEPGTVALAMIETLDQVASPSQLTGIETVDEPGLADLFEALREFELELSEIRRQLHDRIDTIQDEIARRYRDGEASVEALLQ